MTIARFRSAHAVLDASTFSVFIFKVMFGVPWTFDVRGSIESLLGALFRP